MFAKPSTFARILSATQGAVLLAGCSEILELPDDPELVDRWSCLAQPTRSAAPQTKLASVNVQACNWLSTNCSEPVRGLTATLCSKKDVNCTRPIRTDIRDRDGVLSFEVDTGGTLGAGFDGYLRIASESARCSNPEIFGPEWAALCGLVQGCDPKSPSAACDLPMFATGLLFFNPPIMDSIGEPLPLPLIPTAAVSSLAQAANGMLDPTSGNVFVTVLDCMGRPASGVRLSKLQEDGATTILYIDNGVVSSTAKSTDASGLGGLLNVRPGFVSVAGFATDRRGRELRVGEIGVQVARFSITYATIVPTPP